MGIQNNVQTMSSRSSRIWRDHITAGRIPNTIQNTATTSKVAIAPLSLDSANLATFSVCCNTCRSCIKSPAYDPKMQSCSRRAAFALAFRCCVSMYPKRATYRGCPVSHAMTGFLVADPNAYATVASTSNCINARNNSLFLGTGSPRMSASPGMSTYNPMVLATE